MAMHAKNVDIFGDLLEIRWDGNVWVSPHDGQHHSRDTHAMRSEIQAYFSACGDDLDNPKIADQIEGYLSQMQDAD